jgi:hypothetical protein
VPCHGDARFLDGLLPARDERVPPWQRHAFFEQAIGAGCRQPTEFADIFCRECDAIGHASGAVGIVRTLTCLQVEQFAGGPCVKILTSIFVLKLVETAASTAIAEGFPFRAGHFRQGFYFPKWICRHASGYYLAVEAQVETLDLDLAGDAQAMQLVYDKQDCPACRSAPDGDDNTADHLNFELRGAAFQKA